ncbi:MAG: hypothetical protein BJ554DRAFT_775, partial [Olpidium bornovanus]
MCRRGSGAFGGAACAFGACSYWEPKDCAIRSHAKTGRGASPGALPPAVKRKQEKKERRRKTESRILSQHVISTIASVALLSSLPGARSFALSPTAAPRCRGRHRRRRRRQRRRRRRQRRRRRRAPAIAAAVAARPPPPSPRAHRRRRRASTAAKPPSRSAANRYPRHMAGATRNKAPLPREVGSLHEQIEKLRNAAEKTASDNKRTSGQRRADADTLDPNALDVLEPLERVGIQGCYEKKPILTSASDPPASKSTTPRQDGGSSEKDDTRSGHLQQTAGSASASDYPSRSKAKLQSEQTGKRQKGKGVTGDANPPGPVGSDRDTESESILERRRQRKDDSAVIRCRLSSSAHLDPDPHDDTEGAEQDTHQDNNGHHRRRHHQRR